MLGRISKRRPRNLPSAPPYWTVGKESESRHEKKFSLENKEMITFDCSLGNGETFNFVPLFSRSTPFRALAGISLCIRAKLAASNFFRKIYSRASTYERIIAHEKGAGGCWLERWLKARIPLGIYPCFIKLHREGGMLRLKFHRFLAPREIEIQFLSVDLARATEGNLCSRSYRVL